MAKMFAYSSIATRVTRIDQRGASEKRLDPGTASLLAQLGAHATTQFASRLAMLQLAPAHAGILRILAATPGMSQCTLAKALGTLPSRMVGYVDELERKGLLERRPHETDRRNNALHLTKAGQAAYRSTSRLAQEHQQSLLAGLSSQQRTQLDELLSLVANQQGLTPGSIARREQPKGATGQHATWAPAQPAQAGVSARALSHPPCADGCSSAGTTQRT